MKKTIIISALSALILTLSACSTLTPKSCDTAELKDKAYSPEEYTCVKAHWRYNNPERTAHEDCDPAELKDKDYPAEKYTCEPQWVLTPQ